MRPPWSFSSACLLAATLGWIAWAERLPMHVYTSADGLAKDAVHRIVPDSNGFLWFCTGEGLSRFDGYGFSNYRTADGLPDRDIRDLIQTRDGILLIATGSGLCLLDSKAGKSKTTGAKRFMVYRPPGDEKDWAMNVLLEDRSGAILVGSDAGLYRFQPEPDSPASHRSLAHSRDFVPVDLEQDSATSRPAVTALVTDHYARIWIGTAKGLYVRLPGGSIAHYTRQDGLPSNSITSLLEDSTGRIWTGTSHGLCRLVADPQPNRPVSERTYLTRDGLPDDFIKSLLQMSDGSFWVGTLTGLAALLPTTQRGERPFRSFDVSNGFIEAEVHGLAEDGGGNLWIGTNGGGAAKLSKTGFRSYGESDGLVSTHVLSMFQDKGGALCVVTRARRSLFLNRFEQDRFISVRLCVPGDFYGPSWFGWHQVLVERSRREWWAASAHGLLRFPNVNDFRLLATAAPKQIYGVADGLPGEYVDRLFEDSRGNLWLSTREPGNNGLVQWIATTQSIQNFSDAIGLPSLKSDKAMAFFEDRAGQIWIGLYRNGVARYSGGRFTTLTRDDGIPPGGIRLFYEDSGGHLWLGSGRGGLARINNPLAARPEITTYTIKDGLSSDEIQAITEDRWGRIYIGTGYGVDRLEVRTGHVRHYTTADGLSAGEVQDAVRDSHGELWFGTAKGVSRLVPTWEPAPHPPRIRVVSVQVAGIDQPIGETGALNVLLPNLRPNQNQLQIAFVGLEWSPGVSLRYQYRLEGVDQDWGVPTEQRSVLYSGMQPGHYRLVARAINSDGLVSSEPASILFTVLPPFWLRWWFIALMSVVFSGVIYAAYRYRISHVVEIERMRMRIACDLHDDIGSALSQIAILSEVAQRACDDEPTRMLRLRRIAETSRQLLDSIGDIVWAINPRTDHLEELVRRMRAFSTQLFEARDIEFEFEAIGVPLHQRIRPEALRQIYLIFKEGVNNIVRHAGCTKARVTIRIENGFISLQICDDGHGFVPCDSTDHHGVASLRERAALLKGDISWTFQDGTVVNLRVPLHI